ncbi:MAG: hypothetical protein QXP38_08765 [Nitrososphaerota archaeon]
MIDEVEKVNRMWNDFSSEDHITKYDLESRFFYNELVKPILPSHNEASFSLAALRRNPFLYEKNEEGKGWTLSAGFSNRREDLLNLVNKQFSYLFGCDIGSIRSTVQLVSASTL